MSTIYNNQHKNHVSNMQLLNEQFNKLSLNPGLSSSIPKQPQPTQQQTAATISNDTRTSKGMYHLVVLF